MQKIKRPSWDEYWLDVAKSISKRATCLRRRFGVVIVKDNELLGTGYNGSPRGTPNCIDLNKCLRQKYNVPHDSNYNLCRSIHAEMNAILNSREKLNGATLYMYGEYSDTDKISSSEPCTWCKRFIINAKIKKVIIKTETGFSIHSVSGWIKQQNKNPFSEAKEELKKCHHSG
jgi:dCMP deaminase